MSMTLRACDVAYRQVLPDDADGFRWHARLLMHPSPSSDGRWITCTPDLEVAATNLQDHKVVTRQRDADIPSAPSSDSGDEWCHQGQAM